MSLDLNQNLAEIDPYYILPTLTIGMYYWNFERFITPENKDTMLSKIRIACQYFLILWYPFLCCWPSGIVIYMCTNAFMSIMQSSLMKQPWFLAKIAPEVVEYNFLIGTIQYDKGKSDTLIESIKVGEEDFKSKAILQEEIVRQTEKMITELNKSGSSKEPEIKRDSFEVESLKMKDINEIERNLDDKKGSQFEEGNEARKEGPEKGKFTEKKGKKRDQKKVKV